MKKVSQNYAQNEIKLDFEMQNQIKKCRFESFTYISVYLNKEMEELKSRTNNYYPT